MTALGAFLTIALATSACSFAAVFAAKALGFEQRAVEMAGPLGLLVGLIGGGVLAWRLLYSGLRERASQWRQPFDEAVLPESVARAVHAAREQLP